MFEPDTIAPERQLAPWGRERAMARVHRSGLTLAEAVAMRDDELLRHPEIGRRTLRWLRSLAIVET